VILPKLCVYYVISAEDVKAGNGYRPYLHIFGIYDVAYTQFRQDHFGLPEDGAPEAPKHVGAS
jgi:hypothetical protein